MKSQFTNGKHDYFDRVRNSLFAVSGYIINNDSYSDQEYSIAMVKHSKIIQLDSYLHEIVTYS